MKQSAKELLKELQAAGKSAGKPVSPPASSSESKSPMGLSVADLERVIAILAGAGVKSFSSARAGFSVEFMGVPKEESVSDYVPEVRRFSVDEARDAALRLAVREAFSSREETSVDEAKEAASAQAKKRDDGLPSEQAAALLYGHNT